MTDDELYRNLELLELHSKWVNPSTFKMKASTFDESVNAMMGILIQFKNARETFLAQRDY